MVRESASDNPNARGHIFFIILGMPFGGSRTVQIFSCEVKRIGQLCPSVGAKGTLKANSRGTRYTAFLEFRVSSLKMQRRPNQKCAGIASFSAATSAYKSSLLFPVSI